MWRHDDWIRGDDIYFLPYQNRSFAFEAGADAYAEALKKQGTRFNNPAGWTVFIPDEEAPTSSEG